jgi:hypothetical protein
MNERALDTLDIAHVRHYLELKGWRVDKADDRREIWVAPTGSKVFLPMQRLEGFQALMAEVVDRVAKTEERDEDDIVVDLSWPGYDKLMARTHVDSPSSAVPLQEAIESSDALRDLVVAAARASESRQPTFRGGWSANVARYFDQVKMIPSMPGSFTLRALLPINAEPPDQLLVPSIDTASIRSVSRTLLSAVRAARQAAVDRVGGADETVFETAVDEGVSAELLDALVRLGGMEHQSADLELGLTWTYAAPEPPTLPVRIEAGLLPSLAEGAGILRQATDEVPAVLTGSVTRLHRESVVGPGEVTVHGYLDAGAGSATRTMTFELDEETYQTAIGAHSSGATVRVVCTVRFDSPRLTILGMSRFELLARP